MASNSAQTLLEYGLITHAQRDAACAHPDGPVILALTDLAVVLAWMADQRIVPRAALHQVADSGAGAIRRAAIRARALATLQGPALGETAGTESPAARDPIGTCATGDDFALSEAPESARGPVNPASMRSTTHR